MRVNTKELLLDLERRRCEAIGAVDIQSLREMLADGYVHVHATGKVDDCEGYLEGIRLRPRTTERHNVSVRLHGDTAVLVGDQVNRMQDRTSVGVVTQVAIQREGCWFFVSMQVTDKR